jgi:hypothetical protein
MSIPFPNITLGVQLTPEEETKLTAIPGVTVEENPKGAVKPLGIVELRPARLSFGSLREGTDRSAELGLTAPPEFKDTRFEVAARCEKAEQLGAVVEVVPEKPTLDQRFAKLTLRVHNLESLRRAEPQQYQCTLALKSKAQVMFVPAEIAATFDTLPPRTVRVTLAAGADFGLLSPKPQGQLVSSRSFRVEFSPTAKERGMGVRVWVEPGKKNAGPLPSGWAELSTAKGKPASEVTLTPADEAFALRLQMPGAAVRPGKYEGRVVLQSDDGSLEGEGLTGGPGLPAGAKAVRFTFAVPTPPRKPPPWWVLVLLALAALLLLGLALMAVRTAHFLPGACLDAAGEEQPLRGRFGKPRITAGGARSHVKLSTLGAGPAVSVSPSRGDALLCRPVAGVLVQTSGGETVSPAGTLLEPGQFVLVGDPPLQVLAAAARPEPVRRAHRPRRGIADAVLAKRDRCAD